MNVAYFHFTIGPVQGFVSQARRTRDFWAGSFILSWLAGVAMREVIAQCGEQPESPDSIQFPKADAEFLSWLSGTHQSSFTPPAQGCIPNRFKACVELERFNPVDVTKAVNVAWTSLAELIRRKDFQENGYVVLPDDSLWDRQIASFWEINWAVTEDEGDAAVLDERKNWRSFCAPEELGVKCMMMDGWQELSGVAAPNRWEMSEFWGALRESRANGISSDLREGEALCAIAYVKRRFPRFFHLLSDEGIAMPGGWTLHGWPVDVGRPSVSYMAVVHWLEQVFKQAQNSRAVSEQLDRFHESAYQLTKEYGEWSSQIECLERHSPVKKWRALDGDVYFRSVLENSQADLTKRDKEQVDTTLKGLLKLQQMTGLGAASPFYAVLTMDGDNLGAQLQDRKKQRAIASGLKLFTESVAEEVGEHNGFLIYAGGDDVLAVLPTEDALACALSIRQIYNSIFSGAEMACVDTSISAAVIFAHIRTPLTKVLNSAHQLLDDVAKDQVGRNALAARVLKQSGQSIEWSMKWNDAVLDTPEGVRLGVTFMADSFKDAFNDEVFKEFSNRYLYKASQLLELFNPPDDGSRSPFMDEDYALDLLAAEYLGDAPFDNTWSNSAKITQSRYNAVELLKLCRVSTKVAVETGRIYNADGAMLVRFLAASEVV